MSCRCGGNWRFYRGISRLPSVASRGGIHGVDGYPGTPSTEVIDRGLSQVQDMIHVGWSVNEAVAVGVGLGHSLAGHDAVVTMKIRGSFQAGDVFHQRRFFSWRTRCTYLFCRK